MKPSRCTAYKHAPGCRDARPKCRRRRALLSKYRPCHCSTWHFPHRAGSCVRYGGMPAILHRELTRRGGGARPMPRSFAVGAQ